MREYIYQNSVGYRESDGLQIKIHLSQILEDKIKELSGEDGGKIADINFAYYNSWLLDSLRTRGDHIKFQEWDKLNEINRYITEEMHREDNMEKLCTPKCAFVSIESETAYNTLSECEHEGQSGKVMIGG